MPKSKGLKYYLRGLSAKVSRLIYPRYKRKRVILFRYTKALGDALFLTTLAREVKKRNPKAFITVYTGLPKIFENNPDVHEVFSEDQNPYGGKYLVSYEKYAPWPKGHILEYCKSAVDITDEITLKTYLYPSKDDKTWAREIINQVGAHPILINRVAGPRTDKKNWPNHYWEALVPQLLEIGPVIEIGTQYPTPLPNHPDFLDLVGKTSLLQTAALMEVSRLLIAPVTGTIHMAAAFDLPTVCILGGSEPKEATQYPNTHYIENRPSCSDCYEKGPCGFDFKCLKQISVEEVFQKIKNTLK